MPKNPDFDESYTADPLTSPAVLFYHSLLGHMRYLEDISHLGIAFSISQLAQYLMKPTTQHMQLFKPFLRYLIGTKSHSILFQQSDDISLSSDSDADYCTALDRQSTTGHLHITFGAPISWRSKKESTISLSACEAEYLAASHTLQEIFWLLLMMVAINSKRNYRNGTTPHLQLKCHTRRLQPIENQTAKAH